MKRPLPPDLLAHHAQFLSFLRLRVESPETAEEILHGAYLKGMKRADTLRDRDKIIPWFYRLLRNALYDHYRRRGAEARALEGFAAASEQERERIERKLERTVCRCVAQIVKGLKPEYADVLKKAELNDESIKDIARKEGTTPTNVSVRLHRARKQLKQKVLQTCGACAAHACVDCHCQHRRQPTAL